MFATKTAALEREQAVRAPCAEAARAPEAQSLRCPIRYDAALLEAILAAVLDRDHGCGGPSAPLRVGETVLDLGSGAGKRRLSGEILRVLRRGARPAVGAAAFAICARAPYRAQVGLVPPRALPPAEATRALPWGAEGRVRHPRETKGDGCDVTRGGVAACAPDAAGNGRRC